MLRTFFGQIAGPELDDGLKWIIDDLVRLLAATDMAAVLVDFGSTTMMQDPIVHFYETFLAAYDPRLRESRGVYYTPTPVVSYLARSVDVLLKRDLGKPDGLTDDSVIVLDPATGTGTFLNTIVREIITYQTATYGSLATDEAVMMEADYSYDGMGRRVAKLVQSFNLDGDPTEVLLREYVYDGLDVAAEYEYLNGQTTPTVTNYYYANGEKVSFERMPNGLPAQKYWYTYDALGSVAAVTNEAGLTVAEYHHDEYGRLLVGDSLFNHYLFTGQEYDPETGLVHFFARYYDAETGVWIAQDVERGDPMLSSTWHRYMYVLNNPVNMTDPLGYWPDWVDKKVQGAANWVSDTAQSAVDWVSDTAQDAANWVSNTVSNVVNDVKETASNIADAAVDIWGDAVQATTEFAHHVNENYIQPAVEKAKEYAETAREAMTKAADWVQEHKEEILEIGSDYASELGSGTVDAVADQYVTVSGYITKNGAQVGDYFRRKPGSSAPAGKGAFFKNLSKTLLVAGIALDTLEQVKEDWGRDDLSGGQKFWRGTLAAGASAVGVGVAYVATAGVVAAIGVSAPAWVPVAAGIAVGAAVTVGLGIAWDRNKDKVFGAFGLE